MSIKTRLTITGVALFMTFPALAHHGWNGNGNQQFELTGTVEKAVSLSGPHAEMEIRVDDQIWEVTLAPPARTSRAGLREETIPVGAQVTVSGHRNEDPGRYEIKTERVTYDHRTYNVYPDRE
ncbi:MAG: DUF6152 family protein [Pseudohongiellaceae bacterium]